MQTLTLRSTVVNCALCIGSTGVIADVLALPVEAKTLLRAVLVSVGATTFREASCLVGVSNMSSGARAGMSGGSGGAAGRGVARCLVTRIHWSTSHLGQGVWPSTGGAGTLWTLVFRQADSVSSTGVRCTHIHTVEGESVTELGGWTILVCQTGNSLAALDWICGVSFELARRTRTLGRVILSNANCLWTTNDVVAGRDTFLQGLAANFLL